MALDRLDTLDRDQLLEYVHALLWQYRLMDAFWFIKAEEVYGLAAAEDLNARVWAKLGDLSARDIVKRFGPFEPGPGQTPIDAFLAAYAYYPWDMLATFDWVRTGPDELTLKMAGCPPQVARLKRDLGEYACKEMHLGEFKGFLSVIHPSLQVECLYAPPDPHPEDHFCSWRVWVKPEE